MTSKQQQNKRVGTGKSTNDNSKPVTAGGDKIGIDIISLQSTLLNRPARKQSTHINSRYEQHDVDTTEYNIWYGRKLGNKNWKDRDISETRCSVLKDCGKTKAAKDAYFCLHFAKGRCVNGSDCTFIHRVPTPIDDKKTDITHDIFGRERHKTDRDDMGGVGSFSRDNRTIYIGGIKAAISDIEHIVRKHFEEWGNIEYVRVITNKSIAFVRYLYRSSAEFAKEAMADQTMDNGELLNVRWATEDSNPLARMADERNLHRVATEVVNKRLREMSQDDQAALKFQMTGEYPNTDTQYAGAALTDGSSEPKKSGGRTIMTPEPPPPQYQYKGSTNYEQHPYAKMYNKSLEQKRKEGNNNDNIAPLNSVGYYYGHVPGEMNSYNNYYQQQYQPQQQQQVQQQQYTPEQQVQYEEYLKSYYSYYGYDYTKLSEEQKAQLQQYNQGYYYQQNPETPQEQFKKLDENKQDQEQEEEKEKEQEDADENDKEEEDEDEEEEDKDQSEDKESTNQDEDK